VARDGTPRGSVSAAAGRTPRTGGALAVELVDLVEAVAVVQAGAAGALVRVDLAVNPLVTCRETRCTVSAATRGRHNAQVTPGCIRSPRLYKGGSGVVLLVVGPDAQAALWSSTLDLPALGLIQASQVGRRRCPEQG